MRPAMLSNSLHRVLALATVAMVASAAFSDAAAGTRRVNLVFILADNQGAWTLGCYGNPDIRTPNIDRLAADGVRFTRAFANNPVCSPTRATYLTGLLCSQHGVHSFLDMPRMMGPAATNTIEEFTTLPEILAASGYVCGHVGKWHLGASLEPQENFSYWVTMPKSATGFYDEQVIENGQVHTEHGYATDFWTRHAVRFIEQNKDRPFFLYLPYSGPYSLGKMLLTPSRNRHAPYYADKLFPSFPRDLMHPWLFNNKEYLNNLTAIRRVACETSGVDDGVGEVLATLKRLGLEENTLVVYAADQGWMGGQNGLWGMGDHTRPLGAFDQMMHIPLIFRHTGAIPAGATCDFLVGNYDFMTSMLRYLGLGEKIPRQPASPGRDYSPALRGQPMQWDNVMYYEMEIVRAIRTDDYKYVHRHPEGPYELYDLRNDPYEKFNLYGQPAQAKIQADLAHRLTEFFKTYADPRYDIYRGGGSKAALHYLKPAR
jgi:arylsulfatase A-like enzyme